MAVLGLVAACILPASTAHAWLQWPQSGYWQGTHAPLRPSHRESHSNPKLAKKDQVKNAPKGPLQIIISIADQRISVYDNDALIARSSVSTGVAGHPTPLGVFGVISKQRWHRSNIYSAAPMPYMQRITWSGIALHAGVLPGHPASHGCIRLGNEFAIRLWHITKRGTRVIIAPSDIRPVEIADPHLFVAVSRPPDSQTNITESAAITTAQAHPSSTASTDSQRLADIQPPTSVGAAVEPRKAAAPVSVFVSRKSSKLFVRQGFVPLFDVPVGIKDPERPLGTHLFTVLQSPNADGALRWTVVSIPEKFHAEGAKRGAHGKRILETAVSASNEQPKAALDRIEIPQDVVQRISELLTPGSSLFVSDYGISDETGTDTDFILVMH